MSLRNAPTALAALTFAALASTLGCSQETATATLRALDPVGEISLVCLGRDDSGAFTRGLPRSECPEYEFAPNSVYNRRFHALVTQPLSGEVALVDLGGDLSEAVIDYEPTQPGYSFMPVGAEPGAIVSTPGSVASFVGVREAGREGLFALPTSCIAPRTGDAALRDIRTWPACRLPAAPGPMVMLVDPAFDDDANPATLDRVRTSCGGAYVDPAELIGTSPGASRAECPADLATETVQPGRRKLAVMLPSLSEVWVLDAQELLDREPGSFDACNVEERFRLTATTTDAVQRVPADLVPSAPSCSPVGFNHGPPRDDYEPWPVDVALDDEQRLYVADSAAPVIHVLDVSDPCALTPLASLEPRSFNDPSAIVTTRRVAVSQLTPLGKRFVYAVDNSTTSTAGSLMMFDVSPGSTDRTPIVRERSPLNPAEPPDRIALGRDVADVEFVYQDFPEPTNGLAAEGVACDPTPTLDIDTPGAEYRPALDLSSGASPRKLRGTFAFAALHTGQMSVIDVEDLDAACRRPRTTNAGAQDDLAGCHDDDPAISSYVLPGLEVPIPTVSDELSCNVVTPHRARARSYFINAGGQRSAGLVSFPSLTLDTGRSVTTDQTDEGRDYPKLLAARHAAGQDEQIVVGPLRYSTNPDFGNLLDVDPATADRSSLLLSYEEPRAFIPTEDFTAIYEGPVRGVSEALFSIDPVTGLGKIDEGLNASYCSAGVQDMDLVLDDARRLGVTAPADLQAFARRHADYVQIVGDLLDEDDPYWRGDGASCGAELFQPDGDTSALSGRLLCEQFFLPAEVQAEQRDFRIVQASEDSLLLEPRIARAPVDPNAPADAPVNDFVEASLQRRQQLSAFAACCFPDPTFFQIRAGRQWVVRGAATGFAHAVTTDPSSLRCVADCNPMAAYQRGRTYEISCNDDCPPNAQGNATVGAAVPDQDFVCRVSDTANGIDPGEPGSECVFQSLTTRFAIYRGQQPSKRDMRFRWQFGDGFSPLVIGLTSADRTRSTPQSIVPWPENSQLILSDGSARGLTFVSSRNPGTISSIF
ncbi:MAG TPA: hypothetical protein VMG12_14485 [Polyangiaceae bacterium]|nr:hypothetical protein [Polyangiaceae bacterium]